jgi:hypothetical protein
MKEVAVQPLEAAIELLAGGCHWHLASENWDTAAIYQGS